MSELSDGLHFDGFDGFAVFCVAIIFVAKVYPPTFLSLCFLVLSVMSVVLQWAAVY